MNTKRTDLVVGSAFIALVALVACWTNATIGGGLQALCGSGPVDSESDPAGTPPPQHDVSDIEAALRGGTSLTLADAFDAPQTGFSYRHLFDGGYREHAAAALAMQGRDAASPAPALGFTAGLKDCVSAIRVQF